MRTRRNKSIGHAKHWEEWLDISVPALRGETPRQAAKTEEGRELLKALLQEAIEATKREKDEEMSSFQWELIENVIGELGLDEMF